MLREVRVKIKMDPDGSLIENLRKQMGWTQQDLAEITGYSKLYILQLEKKRISNPSIKAFSKIAKALGVELGILWKDYQRKP